MTQNNHSDLSYYQKINITLKSYLKGKGYHKALDAFEFAKERTPGFRNDGVTPSFQHQIEICLFIMTLKEVQFEEDTFVTALLHDVREDPYKNAQGVDCYVEHSELVARFGEVSANAVEKLTKEFKGVKKDTQKYFDDIATCPISSIVKLADRIHNMSSMVGVFTIARQQKYVKEIKDYFFPLLKIVRNRFPQQQQSYYSMKTYIKNTCKTIEAVLEAELKLEALKNLNSTTEEQKSGQLSFKM